MPATEINFKIQDEGRLAELGYTQELQREWSWLHNFGASFSIIVSLISHFKHTLDGWPDKSTECRNGYHNVRADSSANP